MNYVNSLQATGLPWHRLLYALYSALVLVTIQIIFRVIEYSQEVEIRVATSKALFYCPDAVPMLVALVLFNIVHPAIALVGPDSEFPKEKKSQKIDANE